MRAAVVGGGLAGLAAALDLVDAGATVTLLEARPTLGGAVQTLPQREGDPEPPPDNGQHIALGCFTEYLRFLDRIGESGSYLRTRLALPVIAEDGSVSAIKPSLPALLGYGHVPFRDRLRIPVVTARCRGAQARDGETFGALLRRIGASDATVDRFWDVFIRPALNLRTDEVDAEAGLFTVRTALLGPRGNADLVLPMRPLGRMHGDAAGAALRAAGATVVLDEKVASLDDVDAEGVVVAVPPRESARLLGEPAPQLEDSPIVSVHLWFDRPLLKVPLAALLATDAHWVFDRGALTSHRPKAGGQYLTVVSSGAPELLEIRGRELVERIAGQLTERLGRAELLWSRVSREPYATVALRPGVERPGVVTALPGVARAGTWTDTGWPATMESAVRSGRAAAQHLLSSSRAKVGA
ncbi:MAG TPA: hydroxysqualene dehydroxylase HpnE [Gaiellaceae bacterium]|nr:hydroxysqualene dehydroxylase HpnE [Gaiellaceae bacterium]